MYPYSVQLKHVPCLLSALCIDDPDPVRSCMCLNTNLPSHPNSEATSLGFMFEFFISALQNNLSPYATVFPLRSFSLVLRLFESKIDDREESKVESDSKLL